MKEKKVEKVERRRGGKSGQEWTQSDQPRQLKHNKGAGRNCCEVICGAPTTFQRYGIDQKDRKDMIAAPVMLTNILVFYVLSFNKTINY